MKDWLAKLRRIRALTLKETRQVIRDPSSIAIGCVVPLLMILLFGYGLSLDINHVSVAVVDEDDSADSTALLGAFRLSPYFRVTVVHSMAEANTQVLNRTVDGVLRIQSDFSRRRHLGWAEVQILVNGSDANQARIMQGYAQGVVGLWGAAQAGSEGAVSAGPVIAVDKVWFNENNDSHYFLVPGLIVLVMAISFSSASLSPTSDWGCLVSCSASWLANSFSMSLSADPFSCSVSPR